MDGLSEPLDGGPEPGVGVGDLDRLDQVGTAL
jgi:hypothetical protein